MASSQQLRLNKNQHLPKNKISKDDEKVLKKAIEKVKIYLKWRFPSYLNDEKFYLKWEKNIPFQIMYQIIEKNGIRSQFDKRFFEHKIKPDGGILYLLDYQRESYKKVLLISEIKHQGTNNQRIKEGKKKQAQGNAIERLGKNLTGIKTMLRHETITPFICFGWGCDFEENSKTVLAKISMLNEFYEINKIYVKKRDGKNDLGKFSPVSMFFREKKWTFEEIYQKLKEIAETALRHYIF